MPPSGSCWWWAWRSPRWCDEEPPARPRPAAGRRAGGGLCGVCAHLSRSQAGVLAAHDRTGLALGSLALATEPELRRSRIRGRDVATGLASAAALYGVFMVGDRMVRRLLERGGEDIGDVYALRQLGPVPELAARLALVIGPAEELFWRGFVNARLQRRLGRWPGAAAGSFAYAGAHVATGNFTLFGAAGVAGAYWSALAAAGMRMGALVVSHVAWDLLTFLVAPTARSRPER